VNRNYERLVQARIEESAAVKLVFLVEGEAISQISQAALELIRAFRNGRKVLLFGNGGSAADAQHIAAEFVGRYAMERRALPAIALTVNTSSLTAIANDYSYEQVFARQLDALGAAGDVAIGISTSGNSPNILRGIEAANVKGMITLGLTGKDGGKLKYTAQRCICAPSDVTPRIQEVHILIGHILCEIVEQELFSEMVSAKEDFAHVT
jgi:D-sedoheptulose 7-phosphate isomerase